MTGGDPRDPAVDPDGLTRYLARQSPELAGPFEVERLGEGQSCLTFLVLGDGWEVVLRRPPGGISRPRRSTSPGSTG